MECEGTNERQRVVSPFFRLAFKFLKAECGQEPQIVMRNILTARKVDLAWDARIASDAKDESFREYTFHCCSDLLYSGQRVRGRVSEPVSGPIEIETTSARLSVHVLGGRLPESRGAGKRKGQEPDKAREERRGRAAAGKEERKKEARAAHTETT